MLGRVHPASLAEAAPAIECGYMCRLVFFLAALGILTLAPAATCDDGCRYIKSRRTLAGYDTGGPYRLSHFFLTKGRTDLREFLWVHWHGHKKGVAQAKVQTIDAGTVTVMYVIQPDAKGSWGVDLEIDRPAAPPCITLRADSIVRVPIEKPDEEYPSQTLGLWPPDKIPDKRLSDSDAADPNLYRVVLVVGAKPADAI
jgi:hypothetical protein